MAKIVYKEGCEGQNKLSSIEGIEIELLNGQKALIYPKYAERQMLTPEQISKSYALTETQIEALKVENTHGKTVALLKIGSPAAEWVSQFCSDKHSIFCIPSLLAALEIQQKKKEINALAETIEGADHLRDFTSYVWSCSRYAELYCWVTDGGGFVGYINMGSTCLAVPTILYK